MKSSLVWLLFACIATMCACGGSGGGGGASPRALVTVRANLAAERFTLSNGLEVVLHPDPSFRDVVVNVRYDVGSRSDPRGRTGLAHLVEHLTFRSKPDGVRDVAMLVERASSASLNASTSVDATTYFQTVRSEELPLALFVEAARMARPLDGVDEATFATERKVVQNERRQRIDNVRYGNLARIAVALLFENHPYGLPSIGFVEDIERLSLEDARTFVSTYYRPNNATLVLSGGFEPRRARELVRDLFDAIPGGPVPAHPAVPSPELRRVNVTVDGGADAPAVALAWRIPPAGNDGWHEMVLATRMLGHATKARMGDRMRNIDVDVWSMSDASVFIVQSELAKGGDADTVVKEIERELSWLADADIGVGLGDVKSQFIATYTLDLERIQRRADALQRHLAWYGEPNSIQRELHAFSEVRRRDLADAVHRFLRKGRRVRVDVRPKVGAPKAASWPSKGA